MPSRTDARGAGNAASGGGAARGSEDMSRRLRSFHDTLYHGYQEQYQGFHGQHSGETVIINRMKEVWTFMGNQFEDDARFLKNIHKAKNHVEYEAAVRMIFANCAVTGAKDGL